MPQFKVKIEKQVKDKRVNETSIIKAVSVTDAEAIMTGILVAEEAQDFRIKCVNEVSIDQALYSEEKEWWYLAKIFIEKGRTESILVQANSIKEVYTALNVRRDEDVLSIVAQTLVLVDL